MLTNTAGQGFAEAMLQDLSHMDRITQLQDEIQQLLMIMSNSIAYLTSRSNFVQVSPDIPITKQRNPEKYDPPDVFEANKKELVADLMVKAKQVEYLINSLPEPEPEEEQAKRLAALEEEMQVANTEYIQAVNRAKNLHAQVKEALLSILSDTDADLVAEYAG
ncbi:putative subunit 21 of Mediator complex [Lyophyllum shimeji]|uniref:Mediator of RNA polymerase II transcription subunit 21 n=1 Tax=Lyophyllum shimeji TaxID=47721 RepID=A0A9P3PJX6_LYOSH|nr:putative subunit 21 of Mediator complex [Lyophyllum shimeji]